MAKNTRKAHSWSLKVIEDIRKYFVELGIVEEETFRRGMEDESKESEEQNAKVYVKV